MPLTTPEYAVILAQARALFATQPLQTKGGEFVTPSVVPIRSLIGVTASVIAQWAHSSHRHITQRASECVPSTAVDLLDDWASVYDIPRLPASFAEGPVTFTGTIDSPVAAGTQVQEQATGTRFSVLIGGTIPASGALTLDVRADQTGPQSNLPKVTPLQLVAPVAGIDPQATAAEPFAGGADAESDEELRDRLLERLRRRASGSHELDYAAWAKEIPGVSRAWGLGNHFGPGTVGIAIVSDNSDPIAPVSANLTADVQTLIDSRRPAGAVATVFSPALQAVDFDVSLQPNSPDVQQSVEGALEDLILRDTSPGSTLLLSRIREAISGAPGEEDHILNLPTANVTTPPGTIHVAGTFTFSDIP